MVSNLCTQSSEDLVRCTEMEKMFVHDVFVGSFRKAKMALGCNPLANLVARKVCNVSGNKHQ